MADERYYCPKCGADYDTQHYWMDDPQEKTLGLVCMKCGHTVRVSTQNGDIKRAMDEARGQWNKGK